MIKNLQRGDMVIALRNLDPSGANVRKGTVGVVFEENNAFSDGGGPVVRWMNCGMCNVYEGEVERIAHNFKAKRKDPPPGLYKVYWKTGGMSFASIGMNPDGSRWLAPTNWLTPSLWSWESVEYIENIETSEVLK